MVLLKNRPIRNNDYIGLIFVLELRRARISARSLRSFLTIFLNIMEISNSMEARMASRILGAGFAGDTVMLNFWDRLRITAPGSSGTYYITVSVGSYFTTLGYSVY